MVRRPKQESIKKFLHNDKTRFLFSDAAEFANVFPMGEVEMYLKPVPKGGRMKKGHFQIVGHLPNDKSENRESYLSDKEKGSLGRFISGDLKANRMRWNAGSYPGFHLILHDQNGRRQEFFLRGLGSRSKGALVFATMAVPSEKDRKLLTCPVQVGFIGPSASRKGEFKLTLQKPKAECAKGLRTAGHVSDVYSAEEFGADNVMSHEDMAYFYESQGMAYDAESEDATYEPSTEPDMASPATEPTNANFSAEDLFCASCGSYKRAEGHGCGCMGAETFGAEMQITDIDWDTDGEDVDLPSTVMVPSDLEEDEIADYLSDNYGWLVLGFTMGAESESATYEPSKEPDMASPATEPTNANFSAESKSMFSKDKNGKMYARRRNGRIITHNAESLEDYNGMESVVVEPPLGHGVAQWYAETATYEPSSEPDMESPATEPTNANFESESKSMFSKDKNGKMYARRRNGRIITHNAESSPSSFDITWEDAQGLSSPSLPPEGIHFAETEEAFGSVGEGNNFGQMRAENSTYQYVMGMIEDLSDDDYMDFCYEMDIDPDDMEELSSFVMRNYDSNRVMGFLKDRGMVKGYQSDFVVEKPFTTGAKLSAGMLTGVALFSVAGMLGTAALSKLFDKEE